MPTQTVAIPTDQGDVRNDSPLKHQIIDIAQQYIEFPTDDEAQSLQRRNFLQPLLDRLTNGVFRIVVMGEVKKGKSSFINALLGCADLLPTVSEVATSTAAGPQESGGLPRLLPVDTDVATSTVYKILYGPKERLTVFFLPSGDDPHATRAPLEISKDGLLEFGTEAGNPSNEKNVDFIAIEFPSALLKEGIVLVDTPGVGGLFKKHRDITFRFAPNADAILFVLDSTECVISTDEIRFLDELGKSTKQLIFLQTKSDQVDSDQVKAWQQRNLDILSHALERSAVQIPYFPISSKLKTLADKRASGKYLNDSGFLAVVQFLRDVMIPRRDEIVARRVADSLAREIGSEGKRLIDQHAIASEQGQQNLLAGKEMLIELQRKLRDWQTNLLPKRQREFNTKVNEIKRRTSYQIQDTFAGDNPTLKDIIDRIRSSKQSAEAIFAMSEDTVSAYAVRCIEQAQQILHRFDRDFRTAFENAAMEDAKCLGDLLSADISVPTAAVRKTDNNFVDALRNGYMTFASISAVSGMGAYAANWAAGAAVAFGLLTNPIGWAVGVAAGATALATTIWSTVRGYTAVRVKQDEMQLGTLELVLRTNARRVEQLTLRSLDGIAGQLMTNANEAFAGITARNQAELADRIQKVSQAQARTEADAKSVISELAARIKRLLQLGRRLNDVVGRPTPDNASLA